MSVWHLDYRETHTTKAQTLQRQKHTPETVSSPALFRSFLIISETAVPSCCSCCCPFWQIYNLFKLVLFPYCTVLSCLFYHWSSNSLHMILTAHNYESVLPSSSSNFLILFISSALSLSHSLRATRWRHASYSSVICCRTRATKEARENENEREREKERGGRVWGGRESERERKRGRCFCVCVEREGWGGERESTSIIA